MATYWDPRKENKKDVVDKPAPVAASNQGSYQVTDEDLDGGIAGLADKNGFGMDDFQRLNPGVQTLSRGQWLTMPGVGGAAGKQWNIFDALAGNAPSNATQMQAGVSLNEPFRMPGYQGNQQGPYAAGPAQNKRAASQSGYPPPNPYQGTAGFGRDLATQNEILRGYQNPLTAPPPTGMNRSGPTRTAFGRMSQPQNRQGINPYGPQQSVIVDGRIVGYTPTTRLDVVAASLASGILPRTISYDESKTLGIAPDQLKEFYTTKLVDNNHFEYTLKPGVDPQAAKARGNLQGGTIINVNGKNRVVAYDKNGNLYYRTDAPRNVKPKQDDFTPVAALNNAAIPISVLDLKLGSG